MFSQGVAIPLTLSQLFIKYKKTMKKLTEKQYDQLVDNIRNSNPGNHWMYCDCGRCNDCMNRIKRDVRLADVLISINKLEKDFIFRVTALGVDGTGAESAFILIAEKWDLYNNDLDEQSDELKLFLFQIIS